MSTASDDRWFWPTVPDVRPIDADRRVVLDASGRAITAKRDPRVAAWEQRWTDPTGRSRRHRFDTPEEADRFHDDLLAAKRDGWPADPDSGWPLSPAAQQRRREQATPTVDRLLEMYLSSKKGAWAAKTRESYEPGLHLAARWLREAYGHSPHAAHVTRADVRALIERRRHTTFVADGTGGFAEVYDAEEVMVGDATVRNFKTGMGTMFGFAVDEDHISPPPPTDRVRVSSHDTPTRKVAAVLDNVEQLAEVIVDPLGAVVLARGTTAVRPQELRPLRVADVDCDTWTLYVQPTETPVSRRYHNGEEAIVAGGLKARSSTDYREVPILHPGLQEWLRRRIAAATSDTERLFTMPEGGPFNANNFRNRFFNPAVRQLFAGGPLAGLTFYELRHAAIKQWIAMDVPPEVAAEWAGQDEETMIRYYARARNGAAEQARHDVTRQLRERQQWVRQQGRDL